MDIIGSLPTWVVVLLAVLVSGILLAQNIGWLLAARGMLAQQQRKRAAEQNRPTDGTTHRPRR